MSITSDLLTTIDTAEVLLEEIRGLKYLPYRLIWGGKVGGYPRKVVQKSLSRALHRGMAKKVIRKNEVYLALTELGRKFLDKKSKKRPALVLSHSEGKWDGLYRLIFFDIPEKDRLIRDTLRSQLKIIDAKPWQKSVWVTKENITQQIYNFILDNDLQDHLAIVEVREIYNPKLKKLLGTT